MDITVRAEAVGGVGIGPVCAALGLSTATFFRRRAAMAAQAARKTEIEPPAAMDPSAEGSQEGGLLVLAVCGLDEETATAPEIDRWPEH